MTTLKDVGYEPFDLKSWEEYAKLYLSSSEVRDENYAKALSDKPLRPYTKDWNLRYYYNAWKETYSKREGWPGFFKTADPNIYYVFIISKYQRDCWAKHIEEFNMKDCVFYDSGELFNLSYPTETKPRIRLYIMNFSKEFLQKWQ